MTPVTGDWLLARGGLHDARIGSVRTERDAIAIALDDEWSNAHQPGEHVSPGALVLNVDEVVSGDPKAIEGGWISEVRLDDQALTIEFCDRDRLVLQIRSVEWLPSSPVGSPYAEIDGTIEYWVRRNKLALFREWNGEARFWHVSHGQECFQLSIDRPSMGLVKVRARSIETDDDAELSGEWFVEIRELEPALIAATSTIEQWALRARIAS